MFKNRSRKSQAGQAIMEYVLIIAVVGLLIAVALTTFRTQISSALTKAGETISNPQ